MIAYQAQILKALAADGLTVKPRVLNTLAALGEILRKRYENGCNYEWACTPEYEARTERTEKRVEQIAKEAGLYLYLQGDPRGAPIYVDAKPIEENAYNRAHCIYPETTAERLRRRRLAKAEREAS